MHRNLIATGLVALTMAAQPLAAAEPQFPEDRILVAQQNQNQNTTQNQNTNQNQNQNQNQGGDGGNGNGDDDDGDGGDGTPVLTREQAAGLDGYVCFFADAEFAGDAFCTGPNGYSRALGNAWNDRISSIELTGDIEVTVCTEPEYKGTCEEFEVSAETLDEELDDSISSWKVED